MQELDDKLEKKVVQPYGIKFESSEKYGEMLLDRINSNLAQIEELKQKIKDLSEGKDIGDFKQVEQAEAIPNMQELTRKMTMLK